MNTDTLFQELAHIFPQPVMAVKGQSVVFLSEDAKALLGIKPHSAGGENCLLPYGLDVHFENTSSYHRFRDNFLDKLGFHSSTSTVYPFRKLDNEFFLARLRGKRLKDGEDADYILTVEDITGPEREYADIYARLKGAADETQKLKNSYRELLQAVNHGIVILKPDGTVLEVNDYIKRLVGDMPEGDLCYRLCKKLWADTFDGNCSFCRMKDALREGRAFRELVEDRNGNHWFFTWAPVMDSKGHVSTIIKTISEITPEMRLREKIALKDEFLYKIMETLPFGILIMDESGCIEYVNRTFARRWGLESRQMSGALMDELHIYDNSGFVQNIRDALSTGRDLKDIEYQYENSEGKVKILLCDFYALELSDGKRRGILIEADRTDSVLRRRRAESLARDLDREIQERNRAIIEQEKLAAVGRLAAGITHELNTPTTYVRGNLQLIGQYSDALDKEISRFVNASDSHEQSASRKKICGLTETIQNAGRSAFLGTERILNIIQSMRGFVRSDTEADNVINIYEPLRDSIVLTYNRIKRFGKVVLGGWEFDPENTASFIQGHCVLVKGSAQRLSQLFVILLNNSIDAWNHGEGASSLMGRLRVEIDVKGRDGRIHVIYRDNAGGIPKEIEERVFEPFFTTRSHEGGTGLGLSIARQIVKEHGGEITLENYPGRGVCWHISLVGKKEEQRFYAAKYPDRR